MHTCALLVIPCGSATAAGPFKCKVNVRNMLTGIDHSSWLKAQLLGGGRSLILLDIRGITQPWKIWGFCDWRMALCVCIFRFAGRKTILYSSSLGPVLQYPPYPLCLPGGANWIQVSLLFLASMTFRIQWQYCLLKANGTLLFNSRNKAFEGGEKRLSNHPHTCLSCL